MQWIFPFIIKSNQNRQKKIKSIWIWKSLCCVFLHGWVIAVKLLLYIARAKALPALISMFDLNFFQLVSNVLRGNSGNHVTFPSVHQQYVMKHGVAQKYLDEQYSTEQCYMAFYIYETYPPYFGFKIDEWNKLKNHADKLYS